MKNVEAHVIFDAGQRLLEAIHPHCGDDELENFDRMLAEVYELVGLDHAYCEKCDADCPSQLLRKKEDSGEESCGFCPNCQ